MARIVLHLQKRLHHTDSSCSRPLHLPPTSSPPLRLQPVLVVKGSGGHFCAGADIRLPFLSMIECTTFRSLHLSFPFRARFSCVVTNRRSGLRVPCSCQVRRLLAARSSCCTPFLQRLLSMADAL
jgi:hypothetical protein